MSERVFQLSALRIGRTDVGDAVLTIDDDTLVFAVHGDREARALRVTHASIDTLRQTATELALTLRDGTTIAIDVLPELADELVGRCQTVPELTRTLRSFGSRRRGRRATDVEADRASLEQRRFFAPLLEARRGAMHARGASAIAAFDATAIAKALADTLNEFAAARYAQPGPARRALEAELEEIIEPLDGALTELARLSADAAATIDDLRLWRAWSVQLRNTFETADRVWIALDAALSGVRSTT
ncbi:MAG TPA: hypothetical protein VN706_02630 [Gemmatimonadaceae bacterium]|nr:hypothetical protein [Gemmatimonadaceae bacterium]